MIPFNIFGHSKGVNLSDPIVWVDAQDISTYTLGTASGFGSELVVNGDFGDGLNGWSTNSNASASVFNGLARVEVVSSASGYIFQNVIGLQSGKTYNITANGYVGTSTKISLYTAKNGFNDLFSDGVVNINFTATDSDEVVRLYTYGNGTYGEWDNISVKEVLAYDVTNLDNKGTLGGVMTLVNNVKFANGGFESWGVSDYISRDLGEPFLTDNSFTFVTTFFLKDITSGSFANRNWFSLLLSDIENLLTHYKINNNLGSAVRADDISKTDFINYQLGIHTLIISYNIDSNTLVLLNDNGVSTVFNNVVFDNVVNSKIQLLSAIGYSTTNSGQDNPLYDFRLYDKSFTLTEMQDLQIELNDKYLILGNELVVNGDFNTDSDWSSNGNWIISGGTANYDALNSTRYIAQNITQMKKDVMYQVSFDISGGDARLNFVGRDLDNNNNSTSIFSDIGVNQDLNSSSFFFPNGSYNFNTKCLINTTLFRLFAYIGGTTSAGNGTDFSIDNISVKEILN